MRRITWRRLSSTHAYIRVNLLHHQGMIHFPRHFLHTLSQFHYWLERFSANVSTGACRHLSFHRKDSSPPYWKPSPSHRSTFRHRCHSSILTGQITHNVGLHISKSTILVPQFLNCQIFFLQLGILGQYFDNKTNWLLLWQLSWWHDTI